MDFFLTILVFRIIAGVQLAKQDRMIQLYIKELDLLPYGKIKYEDYLESTQFKGSTFNMNDTSVNEGIDYHTLTHENRSINLDTLVLPNGYVVTGVRFILVNGRITLQVRGTQFEYSSGKLINKENSVWISNPNPGQNELILGDVAPSLSVSYGAPKDLTPNSFVKFGPTDFWSDASQLTVPFIDLAQVSSEKSPLSGVGLYYDGGNHYGGYIRIKLTVLNSCEYIPE